MSIIQKVFNLPVKNSGATIEESSGNICAKFNMPNEAKAAANAINHVDALAEALGELISDIENNINPRYSFDMAVAALAAYRGEK